MPTLHRSTVDLHYTISGDGPRTIVLLHGWCDDGRTWDPARALVGPELRCIVPDMRGHGRSGTPTDHAFSLEALSNDVAAICSHEGVTSTLFVGHSFGAVLAAITAARRPDLVSSLLLVDQNFDFVAMASQLGALEPTIRSRASHLGWRKEFLGSLIGAIDGELRLRLEEAIDRTPPDVAMALWAPLFEMSERELGALTATMLAPLHSIPTRVLDRERLPGYHDAMQQLYPRAAFDVIPGGHWLQLEHPELIARSINDAIH